MSTAIAERPAAPVVTAEQLDLIKRTYAPNATTDELQLFLYDNQRQGVHPLDRLIHFSKRGGKYTPITSIDFMRSRAEETGVYAGNDDPVFATTGGGVVYPTSATVTVWKFVQGQRCPFTATARWSEYKPEQNDFMWRKMPHTMLGKCAEALALRKGFPKQLHGLYESAELDQADRARASEIPAPVPAAPAAASASLPARASGSEVVNRPPSGEDSARVDRATGEVLPPPGYFYVQNYRRRGPAHVATVERWDASGGSLEISTIYSHGSALKRIAAEHIPVRLQLTHKDKPGEAYVDGIEEYHEPATPPAELPESQEPVGDNDIPF